MRGQKQSVQYIFVIDAEELLPTPRSEFAAQLIDLTTAAELLKSHKMWFWHFARRDSNQMLQLEQLAVDAGVHDKAGHRLEERLVKNLRVLADNGNHRFILVARDGRFELLTPKSPT